MIFLLALRGKTAHGGGYGSRSPLESENLGQKRQSCHYIIQG
jgi:hypothetical protein